MSDARFARVRTRRVSSWVPSSAVSPRPSAARSVSGNAEQFADDRERQRKRERGDQVDGAVEPLRGDVVEEVVDDGLHMRAQALDPASRERGGDQAAQPCVIRWIDHQHVPSERRARQAFGHDLAAQRECRVQVLRQPRIVQRGSGRVMADDEPGVVAVGERHRVHRAELTQLGEQVERCVAAVGPPRRERLVERRHARRLRRRGSGGGDAESATDDGSRHVECGGVVAQDEVGVGGEDDAVQLEGECIGVLVGGKLVLVERGHDELADECREPALKRGDLFLDRSRARSHLEDGPGEEAAAGERAPHEVVEEGIAHGDELRESGRGGERRFDDLGLEDAAGFVHGGELEILLRAEVGVDAALAHVERARRGCRSRDQRVRRGSRARPPRARSRPGCAPRRLASVERSS